MSLARSLHFVTHDDGSCDSRGYGFSTAVFLCLSVFAHDISKTDAAAITKLDIELFQDDSCKFIWIHFVFAVFTRLAITPPKVNWFVWIWSTLSTLSGAALTDFRLDHRSTDSWRAVRNFSYFLSGISNARLVSPETCLQFLIQVCF